MCDSLIIVYICKKNNMPFFTSAGEFPGKPLKGNERFANLYHYTKFETFLKIWISKKLKFGQITELNDINEALKTISVPTIEGPTPNGFRDYEDLLYNTIEIHNTYRQISLTKDYDSYFRGSFSPMMWGHYGDKGNGVCIELDYSKMQIPPGVFAKDVRYKKLSKIFNLKPDLLFKQNLLEKYIDKHRNELFFTKTIDWKGENEFRLITKEHDYIDISTAISAIYIAKSIKENIQILQNIIDREVPIYLIKYTIRKNGERLPILSKPKL